jgi:hypothetical protein
MKLPTHVKKLAMEAVEGKESTEWIRAYPAYAAASSAQGKADVVCVGNPYKAALRIVSQNETLRQARLAEVDHVAAPHPTPRIHTGSGGNWLGELRRSAQSVAVHEAARESSRDESEMEHGG